MDPVSAFGIVSGVAGIISLGISVCDGLLGYYSSCKNAREDSTRLYRSMERLITTLRDLKRTIQKPIFKHKGITDAENHMAACKQGIEALNSELERIRATSKSQHKFWSKARAGALYPFKERTIQNLAGIVDGLAAHLGLAVSALHLEIGSESLQVISDLITTVKTNRISRVKYLTEQHRSEITRWLSPPDPFSNHNAAVDKYHRDTGQWLLNSAQYTAWRESKDSFLWLHGFAGCGKTILASTAIENTRRYCKSSLNSAIAVFYFDFNNLAKQQVYEMLCSLICQLYSQTVHEIPALESLYERCSQMHKPGVHDLLDVLRESINNFNNAFIILDALDESTNRETLLSILEKISRWELKQLHLLITSRREPDIEKSLKHLVTHSICIRGELVDADIQLCINDRLRQDAKLNQWATEIREEIETTLVKGAKGMFRWVVCQLDVLRKCLSVKMLREALKSLPETLDETYVRILNNIDTMYRSEALRILQVLSYSERPLTLGEAAETLAVNLCGNPKFDPDLRLREPSALLDICASLVTVRSKCHGLSVSSLEDDEGGCRVHCSSEEELAGASLSTIVGGMKRKRGVLHDSVNCAHAKYSAELRFAHYSVKEFLMSKRTQNGKMSFYYISEVEAQLVLAQCCLVFLLKLREDSITHRETSSIQVTRAQATELIRCFPFLSYAAEYFSIHSRLAKEPMMVVQLCVAFCRSKIARSKRDLVLDIQNCGDLDSLDLTTNDSCQTLTDDALYFSSSHGLNGTVSELIKNYGACVDYVYRNSFEKNTALCAASKGGFIDVAETLLDAGAELNGPYPDALLIAVRKRRLQMTQLLIARGGNVNLCLYLNEAIEKKHSSIVQLLLRSGANINELALECAGKTSLRVLDVLISHLKEINDLEIHQKMGILLFKVAVYRDEEAMKWLLEKGANVETSGLWSPETVLQIAASPEYPEKIQCLLSDPKLKVSRVYRPARMRKRFGST